MLVLNRAEKHLFKKTPKMSQLILFYGISKTLNRLTITPPQLRKQIFPGFYLRFLICVTASFTVVGCIFMNYEPHSRFDRLWLAWSHSGGGVWRVWSVANTGLAV